MDKIISRGMGRKVDPRSVGLHTVQKISLGIEISGKGIGGQSLINQNKSYCTKSMEGLGLKIGEIVDLVGQQTRMRFEIKEISQIGLGWGESWGVGKLSWRTGGESVRRKKSRF